MMPSSLSIRDYILSLYIPHFKLAPSPPFEQVPIALSSRALENFQFDVEMSCQHDMLPMLSYRALYMGQYDNL